MAKTTTRRRWGLSTEAARSAARWPGTFNPSERQPASEPVGGCPRCGSVPSTRTVARTRAACRGSRAVRELVEYIAKALVDHPEQVRVTQVEGTRSVILERHAAPEDRGRVIGKQGRIVGAIRTVLDVASSRGGKRVTLVVV